MRRHSVRADSDLRRVDFEKLEDRNLLSGTTADLGGALLSGQENLILNHIAQQQETAHLLTGGQNLDLAGVQSGVNSNIAIFGQTMEGLPVHGSFVTVEISTSDEIIEIKNHASQFIATQDSMTPDVALATAQEVANIEFHQTSEVSTTGELVWFRKGGLAELAWRIETVVPGANTNQTDLELTTIVDAQDGSILSQAQAPSALLGPVNQTGIKHFPRIVINDTIGPAGSQEYADPFDSVVSTPGCTGTLIASNVVISARHCGTDAGGSINFGEDSGNPIFTATVESSILPDGAGTLLDGGDVSILILTADVPEEVAIPMRFIDATDDLVGQTSALIGYGLNGVGSTGHQGSSDGLRWGGENIIDAYGTPSESEGANIISTDFDDGSEGSNTISGSDPNPIEFEATTAPGDSGGPILIDTGSEWAIAGVLSGGTSPTSQYGDISWWTGTSIFREDIEAVGGEFVTFGEIEVSFEGDVIEDGSDFDFGVTALGTTVTRTLTVTNLDPANDLELFEPIIVPDAWTVSQSFGELLLGPGESTTFDVRLDSNPYGTYEGELSFENGDGDKSPFNLNLKGVVAPPIGEAGTISAGGRFKTVFLRNTYQDPVVIVGPATFNDADPVTVRVRNVTSDSFQVRAQKWSYQTEIHSAESISYVVVESGIHRLADGTTIIARNTDGITPNFQEIPFEIPFEGTPVVVAQAVTTNGGAPIVTRLSSIDSEGFEIKIQEEEAADQTHNPETIAWMATLPNQEDLGVSQQASVITGRIVDEDIATIPFENSFTQPPVFLANMQSYFGSNTATLRVTEITENSVSMFVEEEQSRDEEVGHGFESVGYFAIDAGDIVGRTIIGEAGQILNLDRTWQTIELKQDYIEPVVVAAVNSLNEADPGVVRIRNITSNSFEIHFEEWNYLDLEHAPEMASYVVFEAGTHRLRDGTVIEARNSIVDEEWTPVAFANDFGGETPVVFSQIGSTNGPATATTRLKNVSDLGFEVQVQEEEASSTPFHNPEKVGWIAMQQQLGDTGGVFYEARVPDTPVNHIVAATIPFFNTFDDAPAVIARQQTTYGTNTASVRQTFVSAGRVDLFIEEEQSLDKEVGHIPEDIGILALSLGIIDGFIIELPSNSGSFGNNITGRSLGADDVNFEPQARFEENVMGMWITPESSTPQDSPVHFLGNFAPENPTALLPHQVSDRMISEFDLLDSEFSVADLESQPLNNQLVDGELLDSLLSETDLSF